MLAHDWNELQNNLQRIMKTKKGETVKHNSN